MKAYLYVDHELIELPDVTGAVSAQSTGTFVRLMKGDEAIGLLNAVPGCFVYWGENPPVRSNLTPDFSGTVRPGAGWGRPATETEV